MSELTHFGVPGMKWGHRKTNNKISSTKPIKKKYTKAEIMAARKRQNDRAARLSDYGTAYKREQTEKGRKVLLDSASKLEKEYLTSKDYKLSNKATRGEKIAIGLLGTATVGLIAAEILTRS